MVYFGKKFDLFLVSFLTLFFELAMIRWIPGTVTIVSYFTNLILISSFFGMGLGALLAKKRGLLRFLPAIFFSIVIFAIFMKKSGISSLGSLQDFLFLDSTGSVFSVFLVIPLIFFLNFLFFVPLGQILGKNFDEFQPLNAYIINIFGAIIGVVAFTFISFFSLPPVFWFALGMLLLLWFFERKGIHFYGAVAIICLSLIVIGVSSAGETWSPYYKITVEPENELQYFSLGVNNNYYMTASKFDGNSVANSDYLKTWKEIYNLPYKFVHPKTVLIVGCGGANDLVLALESEAESIDCVEIDPKIVEFARVLRKDKPYDNPKVNVFVDDARSFIRNSDKKYDLIVYGFLDSHRLFANMANIRLDNFVYTTEGIKEAKEHLNENGVIALSFYAVKPWVSQKLYDILKENFSSDPLVFSNNKMPFEKVFIATEDSEKLAQNRISGFAEESEFLKKNSQAYKLPEDNWPYLYLGTDFIPAEYLFIVILILFLCILIVKITVKPLERVISNFHFLLLGAAFMLLETKSIVEFSLLFGSSWLVISIVITAILIMILLANLYLIKFNPKRLDVFYLLLFVSLMLTYFFPPKTFVFLSPALKLIVSSFVVALPIFFAGIVFGFLFKRSNNPSSSLGLNLIGGVVGGFLEYSSLLYGINNLVVIAFAIYLLSYLFARKSFNGK